MMTTINRPSPPSNQALREDAYADWTQQEENPLQIAQNEYAAWLERVSTTEKVFQQHVYQNENLTDFDVRQHRTLLHGLIYAGEGVALSFVRLQNPAADGFASLIDDRLKQLNGTLREWHGLIDQQNDIPESFKQASREVSADEFEDFEDDWTVGDVMPVA